MGSVKSLNIEQRPTPDSLGRGSFVFTDDYSVFDWGKMPDKIDQKGASLCTMGAFTFELLEKKGVSTHYRGIIDEKENDLPPNEMAVELTQVPELTFDEKTGEYDYNAFHNEGGENYLVPLEVIFRNAVPPGSSVRDRYEPPELGVDADEWSQEAVSLDEPLIEFSTKFEEKDRYLDDDEARRIAGLGGNEFEELRRIAHEVNEAVTEHADAVGLSHQDGKVECLYHDGGIKVADVAGTFDENRFLRDRTQVSKEFLRQFYKEYDPEWVDAVSEAKRKADDRGVADWRPLTETSPKPLPDEVCLVASNLYCAGANTYTESYLFDAPELDEVLERVEGLLET